MDCQCPDFLYCDKCREEKLYWIAKAGEVQHTDDGDYSKTRLPDMFQLLSPIPKRNALLNTHTALTLSARTLMEKKNQDYGANDDPFRNFREFGTYGILVRLSDKLARLRTFEERGSFMVADEQLKDTIMDAINYLVLYYAMKEEK